MRILLHLFLACSIAFCGCSQKMAESDSRSTKTTEQTALDEPASMGAANQAPQMKLIWQDEFDGESLDLTKWKFETGGHGWGNNELQNYTDGDNVQVEDGKLKITAIMTGDQPVQGAFTSARLNSLKSFQYGRLEVRAKIPAQKGNGVWPAIWMLPDSFPKTPWPLCGEIDIMEYVSCAPDKVHFTVHSKSHNHMTGTHKNSGPIDLPTIDEAFHVYGFVWSKSKIEFYLDKPENIQFTVNRPENATEENWPFEQPYYFLLNVAVGGSWGGMKGIDPKAFPSTLEIDYVRVYQ